MAKKNNTKRKLVGLVSEESGIRQYYTKKNTMNTPDKLSLKNTTRFSANTLSSPKRRKTSVATKSKRKSVSSPAPARGLF